MGLSGVCKARRLYIRQFFARAQMLYSRRFVRLRRYATDTVQGWGVVRLQGQGVIYLTFCKAKRYTTDIVQG